MKIGDLIQYRSWVPSDHPPTNTYRDTWDELGVIVLSTPRCDEIAYINFKGQTVYAGVDDVKVLSEGR
jgi:hypothetical protein